MKYHFLLITLSVFILSNCQICRNNIKSQNLKEISLSNSFVVETDDNPFNIEKAEIQGNELLITVKFKGNKNNEFDLMWNGAIMKSLPPKAPLSLVRKTSSKAGNKQITILLKYDLNIFLDKIPNTESVVLLLKGYDKELIYKMR